MKKFYIFIALFLFISSSMKAQNSKNSSPAKVSEQKEIKATNHLKKEIEQKQLSATPERIADTLEQPLKNTDKRKNKSASHRHLKKRKKNSA